MNNIEKRIDELLSQMTLEEKVAMCHGNSKMSSAGVERLGIGELTMSDGPHGVRTDLKRDSWEKAEGDFSCTYLPTCSALAATWDTDMAELFGKTLGEEARFRGKDLILGPGVNIMRTPLCGRNFEYFSEDPCLTSKLCVPVIKAVNACDTAACVKHYALNNQELDRGKVDVTLSERALREIYLPAFEAAVKEGGVLTVMGAYNKYNGQHCCHNHRLINEVLKGEFGFDGLVVSDWAGTHDTEEALRCGLDVEMGTNKPYNENYLADAALEMAKNDPEIEALVDDKVRRILRVMLRINKLSPDRLPGSFNTPEHQQAAYGIAAGSMVLLKNEGNLLPLDGSGLKNILVVGRNGDTRHAAGGNSSGIDAFYERTPLDGLRRTFPDAQIEYIGDLDTNLSRVSMSDLCIIDFESGSRAIKVETFASEDFSGEPLNTEFTVSPKYEKGKYYRITFAIMGKETVHPPISVSTTAGSSMKMTLHTFGSPSIEFAPVISDGGEHIFERECKGWSVALFEIEIKDCTDPYLEFSILRGAPSLPVCSLEELLTKAQAADCVIYCGGLSHDYDTESSDKPNMRLPEGDDELISALLDANERTVICLTAGSPVEMPWIDKAKSVVWTWYAGMEGGNVLGDILTGKVCPSGKMPFTLPVRYEDTSVAKLGEYKAVSCAYNDDIMVGYRWFEHDGIKPMFPFGHGLSYSAFEYSGLTVGEADENGCVEVEFDITNVGSVAAAEAAQVYVTDDECSVVRPKKELRGFCKLFLEPGQTKRAQVVLCERDFMFFDEAQNKWTLEPGAFTISVAASAEDIRLTQTVEIK